MGSGLVNLDINRVVGGQFLSIAWVEILDCRLGGLEFGPAARVKLMQHGWPINATHCI